MHLYETVCRYLETHWTLTLAVCSDQVPWAAALFYASDARLNLYFISDLGTRHAQMLAANARVAITVNEDYHDWRAIQGLQIEGAAEQLQGEAKAKAYSCYVAKFPFMQRFLNPSDDQEKKVATRLATAAMFRVVPSRVLFIDNRWEFGQRQELWLSANASSRVE